MTVNVLFTSAGRRVELLRAFRRAYEALGLEGRIIATDLDPLAPALQAADRTYMVPAVSEADYIPSLVAICQKERVGLVFPLIDPDIPVLARHREAIEATGAKVVAVSQEVATLTSDKWTTDDLFRRLAIRTPLTWLPDTLDPAQITFPLFVKPRRGSAGKDSFKVNNERELATFLDRVPEPVIQEFLPGPEVTTDTICSLNGQVSGVLSRQRIEVRSGEVAKGVTIHDPAIQKACIKIAQALSAVGPLTIQCIMKAGKPYFTEVNARFGGGIPLSIAAGVDSPRWLLAEAAGIQVDIPPLASYQVGLLMTRFDDSYFLTKNEYEQLASRHI